MLVTPEIVCDNSWYPDSSATNHVTSEASNLMSNAKYNGPEQLYVGDGKGLTITHVGYSMFLSFL